jgi:hypothetical protein
MNESKLRNYIKMKSVIIEMTPFIFEDGNTYYFQVLKRKLSNDYHNLFVYEKIMKKKIFFIFWKKDFYDYVKLNESPELISVNLNTNELKKDIYKILTTRKVNHLLKDWDGFVGNIPDDVKKNLKRENSLKSILDSK